MAALESVAEQKSVDVSHTFKCDSSGTQVDILGNTFQGIAAYQRIGRNVKVVSIHFKGYLSSTPAQPTASQLHRLVIFEATNDPIVSGTSPTWSQLYQGLNGAGAAINSITAGRNLNFSQNFRVLAHREIFTPGTGTGAALVQVGSIPGQGQASERTIDIFLNNLKISQKYTGASNVDGVSGSLGIAVFSTGAPAAVDFYSIIGTSRVKYIDA